MKTSIELSLRACGILIAVSTTALMAQTPGAQTSSAPTAGATPATMQSSPGSVVTSLEKVWSLNLAATGVAVWNGQTPIIYALASGSVSRVDVQGKVGGQTTLAVSGKPDHLRLARVAANTPAFVTFQT